MDDLKDIGLFVAVAESRSFTRASARLGVPTSTVSRRIAALESSLGFPLLHRNTRSVELTEAGAIYLARCQAIVEEARSAREEVRAQLGRPQGLLRVSMETEIGPRLARPVVTEYLNEHPDVRIDLDISPRRVDLIAEGFDLAVRVGRLPDSTLTVRRLALLRAHLFASPAYVERHGEPAHPKELEAHRRIHLFHKGDDGLWELSRGRATAKIENNSVLSTNSMPMAKIFALDGLGIAAVDEFLAKGDVEAGQLVRVLPEWSLHSYPISVLTPSRLVPLKARLFIDMLITRINATPGLSRR